MTISGKKMDNVSTNADEYFLLINGQWTKGKGAEFTVLDKFHHTPFTTINAASPEQVSEMVAAAEAAFLRGAPSPYERGQILDRAAQLVEERIDLFVHAMQAEAGFTASDAAGEVGRCVLTLKLSGEEARRMRGDIIPMSGAPNQEGRLAFTIRVPLGVIVAITPFNSPLNTVAHKIGPAFAAGNSVVLKPSTNTPVTACLLAQVFLDAGLPTGFLSLLHGGAAVAKPLLDDQRVSFYAFTGSTEVGKSIQQAAGLRRTQMELGSIAFTILCDDADLDLALPKILGAGYRKAGQVCTSVQILLVHQSIFENVQERFTTMVKSLSYGDPYDEGTFVGPMISEGEAKRVESWIGEAISNGAKCLAGGSRLGSVIAPTLLVDVDQSMQVATCEIFGPVVVLKRFTSLDEAIEDVNSTPFGLATGVFTDHLQDAIALAYKLQVGGVHINQTSSSRVDMMPYGGSKDSGFGREGPYYAVHEMTEERIITISTQ